MDSFIMMVSFKNVDRLNIFIDKLLPKAYIDSISLYCTNIFLLKNVHVVSIA